MSTEYSSGVKFKDGDKIRGYQIVNAFDPGGFAFAGKARASTGLSVFFKKYKRPGGSSPWLAGFIAYQTELKRRIQADVVAKSLCYEFIEFFEMSKSGGSVPLRAFYQVFEWVEGGKDLRKVIDEIKGNPATYDWNQRVIFGRVMMAGINAIHKAGVIHTDIKPENFYLLPEPAIAAKYKLRVIDLDFSLLEGKQAPWHGHEGYVGTPGYMSPEHLAGKIPVKASDVFTLGLILGELLAGGHPAAPSLDTYDDQVKNGRLKPVTVQKPIERVTDLDFLNHVINGCFRPEPSKRPTAEQVLMALNGELREWDGKSPNSGTPKLRTEITKHPAGADTDQGKALQIVVEAKGSGLRYVWKKDGSPIAGATGPSYSVANVELLHAGEYTVQVIGAGGTVESNPAVVTVRPMAVPPALTGVELMGPAGQKLRANIPTTFGRSVLKAWGAEYEKFMSSEQFHLRKDASGRWMIEHCASATNATNANGSPVTGPTPVQSGMMITLGKTDKCPITLNLG